MNCKPHVPLNIEKLADAKMAAEATETLASKRPYLVSLPVRQLDEYKHLARGASAKNVTAGIRLQYILDSVQ